MGYLLYLCAVAWASMAHAMAGTDRWLCYLIANISFVGGAVVFAINDIRAAGKEPHP